MKTVKITSNGNGGYAVTHNPAPLGGEHSHQLVWMNELNQQAILSSQAWSQTFADPPASGEIVVGGGGDGAPKPPLVLLPLVKTRNLANAAGRSSFGRIFVIFAVLSCTAILSHATPVHYNVQLELFTSPIIPATGSFDYDAAASSGQQFSNFLITWNGMQFDLAAPANTLLLGPYAQPNSCFPSLDSAGVFHAFTTPSDCGSYDYRWSAYNAYGSVTGVVLLVSFQGSPGPPSINIADFGHTPNPVNLGAVSYGTFTVTAATPEPAPLTMLLMGAIAIMAWRRMQTH
jgi:hypothetical protein